jgi:hypothetical protein
MRLPILYAPTTDYGDIIADRVTVDGMPALRVILYDSETAAHLNFAGSIPVAYQPTIRICANCSAYDGDCRCEAHDEYHRTVPSDGSGYCEEFEEEDGR